MVSNIRLDTLDSKVLWHLNTKR